MKYLSDKYLLEPIIHHTDFLYQKLGLTPNAITGINWVLVTNSIFYCWFHQYYYYAYALLMVRNILDASDGYIARKYNLKSYLGELLDHIGDISFCVLFSVFVGFLLEFKFYIIIMLAHTLFFAMTHLYMNPKYKDLFTSLGAFGNYDSFITIGYSVFHLIVLVLNK